MKTLSIFLLCVGMLLSLLTNAQDINSLNGKTFSVKLEVIGDERPGRAWTRDEITFHGKTLISKEMSDEQFPAFDCTFTADSSSKKAVHFTASGKNKGVSDIQWEGTINGGSINGTAIWTNANGPQTHRFSGTLKKN
jgi:hypothetical protein